jgi:hypothetical protein
MDEKSNFSEHVDVRLLVALLFEFTSVVYPKLEYASCVWSPFYDVRVDKVERVWIRFIFIRYALRSLGGTNTYDLPPYF